MEYIDWTINTQNQVNLGAARQSLVNEHRSLVARGEEKDVAIDSRLVGNCLLWAAWQMKARQQTRPPPLANSLLYCTLSYMPRDASDREDAQLLAKLLELRATVSLCRMWRQQGKTAEARPMLTGLYGWFTEGFATVDLQQAEALLDELT